MRGVADVVAARADDFRETCPERDDNLFGIVNRERGLCHISQPGRVVDGEGLHILHRFDEIHAAFALAHGAFDFRVPLVADHDNFPSFAVHPGDFEVYLGDQRAGGVKDFQPARGGLLTHCLRDAMRAENDRCAGWHLIQFIDKHGSLGTQVIADVLVVHDFVTDIDRCAEFLDGPFNDGNGPFDTGTETTGIGEEDFHSALPLN